MFFANTWLAGVERFWGIPGLRGVFMIWSLYIMGNFLAVGVPRLQRWPGSMPGSSIRVLYGSSPAGPRGERSAGAEFVPSGAGEAALLGLFSGELLRLQARRRSGGPCFYGFLYLSLSLSVSLSLSFLCRLTILTNRCIDHNRSINKYIKLI